jgi:hypothetical protein
MTMSWNTFNCLFWISFAKNVTVNHKYRQHDFPAEAATTVCLTLAAGNDASLY